MIHIISHLKEISYISIYMYTNVYTMSYFWYMYNMYHVIFWFIYYMYHVIYQYMYNHIKSYILFRLL